jgi:hypothetical protein
MAFTEQHKVFMVMSYFRNGVKIDGVWQYSLALCMEEFGEFPDIAVEYTQFRQTLNICLKNFQENGTVERKPGSDRPKKRTPEVIEEARQAMEEAPGTSIEHLSQQLPYRLTSVHPADRPQRLEYCQWFTLIKPFTLMMPTSILVDMSTLKIQECGVQKIHIFSLKHPSTPRK